MNTKIQYNNIKQLNRIMKVNTSSQKITPPNAQPQQSVSTKTEQHHAVETKSSYGFQIPTKQQMKELKKKVALMKEAIIKQRGERQIIEQQLKALNTKYTATEQILQKKQQKNQNLLHESRQLKDILIREKQQIKNIQSDIQMLKEKKRKQKPSAGNNAQGGTSANANQPQGWKNYLTSFWK